jgi:catechol 2,3-dioxygenase-like lactoylglutathione lyase family enzyme
MPPLVAADSPAPTGPHARFGKLSPVLIVDDVELCLAFWTERLGFRQANAVPGEDGGLVFASAERDAVEVMYQSRASVLAAEPEATRTERARDLAGHAAALFLEVDDLDAVERALAGVPVVKARHETFYGTAELYVREPGGTTVGFSMRLPGPPAPDGTGTAGTDP